MTTKKSTNSTNKIDDRLRACTKQKIPIENALFKRTCIRLYLREETADVHFIFNRRRGGDATEQRIPAHKVMLASGSPVFHSMFYGKLKEVGNVTITDCRVESFKEFLQFFYLADVQLTMENIGEVMNLVNKYDATDCFKICEQFLMQNFSVQTACWILELAIVYDRIEFCQLLLKKMMKTPIEVFATVSFKNCTPEVLKMILGCERANCNEKSFFEACIDWASNACVEKNVDPLDMTNVREQLDDCFHLIQFTAMSRSDIAECISKRSDLFSKDELVDIIGVMASDETYNATKSKYFVHKTRFRSDTVEFVVNGTRTSDLLYVEMNCFVTNRKVSLRAVGTHMVEPKANRIVKSISGVMKIGEMCPQQRGDRIFFTQQVVLNVTAAGDQSSASANVIELIRPVVLDGKKAYCVRFEFEPSTWLAGTFSTKNGSWKQSVFTNDNFVVVGKLGLVSSLFFKKP